MARVGRSSGRPDPRAVPHIWVDELVTDGGYGLVGAGVESEMGIGVVGEALNTIRGGPVRLYDRDVAGIAGRIG